MQTFARFFLFFTLVSLFALPAQADLPGKLAFGDTQLTQNGKGTRKKWMMNVYEGALYLQSKSSNASGITNADEPMAIRLDITSGLITSEKMEEALMEGLKNSTGGNIAPMQADVDQFIAVFQEEIKEGDIFDLFYNPGTGIEIFKNGAEKGAIDGGMDFKKAIWGIWLGDKPADKNLKKGMLGG